MKIQGKYRKIETALKAIENCLAVYYRTDETPRNAWRVKEALKSAKHQLETKGECRLEGAQWGGKFGNHKRCVALNGKGEYVYVEGFDNQIKNALK